MAGQTRRRRFGVPPEDWSEWVAWLRMGLQRTLALAVATGFQPGFCQLGDAAPSAGRLAPLELQAAPTPTIITSTAAVGRKTNELATRLFFCC